MVDFVSTVGDRLHRIGLFLARVESEVGPGDTRDHLEQAIAELDRTIGDLRATAFKLLFEEEPSEEEP